MLGAQKGWIVLSRSAHSYPSAEGMSLLELVVVLAILGILLTTGLSNFSVWIGNSQIRAVAEAQLAALRSAKSEAIKLNSPVQIQFDADFRGWTITVVNTNTTLKREANLSDFVNIVATPLPANANTVVFDGLGRVTQTVVGVNYTPITQLDLDNAKLTAVDSSELRLVVTPAGGVLICRPDKLAPDPSAC